MLCAICGECVAVISSPRVIALCPPQSIFLAGGGEQPRPPTHPTRVHGSAQSIFRDDPQHHRPTLKCPLWGGGGVALFSLQGLSPEPPPTVTGPLLVVDGPPMSVWWVRPRRGHTTRIDRVGRQRHPENLFGPLQTAAQIPPPPPPTHLPPPHFW